jgi:tripartite-type tricarboxylate transporter receptor subunit TctC
MLARLFAGLLLLAAALPAGAQPFPTRPVVLVVPFAVGGVTDNIARLIAGHMAGPLGQPMVVENVGGAGGTIGASSVARAAPDGYRLLIHHVGHATAATLYRTLPFDTVEDFAPVGLVTDSPMVMLGHPSLPPRSLPALVDWLKARGDRATLGNAGIGSASHLCGMLFMSTIGVELTVVPYRGGGPMMTDMLSGRLDLTCSSTDTAVPLIRAGSVHPFVVTHRDRLPYMPEVASASEAGFANFEVSIWHGVYAARGTPRPVVERLGAAFRQALAEPAVKTRLLALGTDPARPEQVTPEALRAQLVAEVARWAPLIRAAGIYAN